MEKGENKNKEESWTEEDEKTLNNLLASIESAKNRLKEIEIEKAKIKEIAAEIEKIPEEEKPETSEKERTKGDEFQTNPIQNLQEKSGIPIATEVFNEKRSIKDVSGKEITKGDIVTDQSNQDWLVCGFIERKIAEKYLKPGKKDFILYANLAKYENGEVNFNARTSAEDGEYALKEKWQPKYRNGEIIKMGDIVKANVEKFMFEVYNKKLKVVGFNLDGFVSVEVLDNSGRKEIRAVSPSVLEIFHEKEESATEQKTGTEEQKESKKEEIEKRRKEELEEIEKKEYGEVSLEGLKTIYLPAPNKNETFNDNDKLENFKETESVYEFKIINKEGTKAIFKPVQNKEVFSRTSNLPDAYLLPATEGSLPRTKGADPWANYAGFSKYTTYEAGEARLEDGKWIVTKKAKVYFNDISPKNDEIEKINKKYDTELTRLKKNK